MLQHGTCVARRRARGGGGPGRTADEWEGVLLLGPPGSGKSDLALRLIFGQRRAGDWRLVADDQVRLLPGGGVEGLTASAPEALRGMLEARGVGLLEGLDAPDAAHLALVVELVPREAVPRLPRPRAWAAPGGGGGSLPLVALCAHDASAPERVSLALDAATGAVRLRAGAFGA